MTEKVKCAICGEVIPKKESVMTFDIGTSQAMPICTPCYYKELEQEIRERQAENNGTD